MLKFRVPGGNYSRHFTYINPSHITRLEPHPTNVSLTVVSTVDGVATEVYGNVDEVATEVYGNVDEVAMSLGFRERGEQLA